MCTLSGFALIQTWGSPLFRTSENKTSRFEVGSPWGRDAYAALCNLQCPLRGNLGGGALDCMWNVGQDSTRKRRIGWCREKKGFVCCTERELSRVTGCYWGAGGSCVRLDCQRHPTADWLKLSNTDPHCCKGSASAVTSWFCRYYQTETPFCQLTLPTFPHQNYCHRKALVEVSHLAISKLYQFL